MRLALVGLAVVLSSAAACGSSGTGVPRGAAVHSTAGPPPATRAHHRRRHAGGKPKHAHRRRRGGVPAADMPNPRLTPGVVRTVSAAAVCRSGYASQARDVPESESEAVYARYGVAHVPYAHEVDHLVSLELGGSNAIRNLWPEPYAGRWGARAKDALENRLHGLVCSGAMGLRHAQRIVARDWVAAYRRYIGSPVATGGAGAAGAGSGGGGAPGPGCEPGYAPCLPVVGDLDCADIPASKKPVHVSGPDPYRLDGDGDGLACE